MFFDCRGAAVRRHMESIVMKYSEQAVRWTVAATVLACAGLINPRYTPVHVVAQSQTILRLEIRRQDDALRVRVDEALKGAAPAGGIRLDLSETEAQHAQALRKCVGEGGTLALLFIRAGAAHAADEDKPDDDADDQPAVQPRGRGALHIAGQWFVVSGGSGGVWEVDRLDTKLQETWAGGTDMLLGAVRYILADRTAAVPVVVGASWESHRKIATVAGRVYDARAVDLDDDGRWTLYLACDGGDKLLRWDAARSEFVDITQQRKLEARSKMAAWGDFDNDGRIDLASGDGRSVRFFFNRADGFSSGAQTLAVNAECIGLASMAVGAGGRAGVLASTAAGALMLVPDADKWAKTPLGDGGRPKGRAYACLVADFNGDGAIDVLQPMESGSLLYPGDGAGGFGRGVECDVQFGARASGACIGDYDADGFFDIFVAGPERCMIWHNRGGGRFEETLHLSGEIGYIARPNARSGITCDINSDGRQDILITYADAPPQMFFNRGFRSFGHAHSIDLAENELLAEAKSGQQAAAVADFNGDGAQDMALVLENGEVWVFLRRTEDAPVLAVRAVLPAAARRSGPVRVTGVRGHQSLGAWNVFPGVSEAYFGASAAGTIRLSWQFPGTRPQQQEMAVNDRVVRFLITPPNESSK